jgi:hypothetical protein
MKWMSSGRDNLERVIPVAQSQTSSDTEITLSSVETYNGGFVLNYRIRSVQAKNAARDLIEKQRVERRAWEVGFPQVRWEATDDVGTKYQSLPEGSGGSPADYRGSTAFVPELSKRAKKLVFSATDVHWSGAAPSDRSEIEATPWRFEIPLT